MDQSVVFAEAWAEGRASEDGSELRGILLCGQKSLNGYEFAPNAWGANTESVGKTYNGVPVYLDHDTEKGLNRGVRDLAGVVQNARLENGLPRGDVLLAGTSAGKELKSLFEFSKKAGGLKGLGMSHCASYRFADKSRKHVEAVEKVYSVDCVCRPASTKTFSEGDKYKMNESELQDENARLKGELERLKAKEALILRADDIREEFRSEGIDPDDKVINSVVFSQLLLREPSPERRRELIRDRKESLTASLSSNPTSRERRSTSKEFDAEKFVSNATFTN